MLTGIIDNTHHHGSIDVINIITRILPHLIGVSVIGQPQSTNNGGGEHPRLHASLSRGLFEKLITSRKGWTLQPGVTIQ